jgi:hypothetical protein
LLAALAGRIYDNAPQQNAVPLGRSTNSLRGHMMRFMVVPVALGLAFASPAGGQSSRADEQRFSAAVGVTTSRLDFPQMTSSSLSVRLLPLRYSRFQLQADATIAARRLHSFGGVASIEGVFYHQAFGLSLYEMLGIAVASNQGLAAGGIGLQFRRLNRPMFLEFRAYGPGLHDYNGFRIGTRF